MGAATTDDPVIRERGGVPQAGEALVGKYRVEGTVGTGGMGAAAPIVSRALTLACRLSVEGPHYDRHELASDPPQRLGEPFVIWDLILTGQESRTGLAYALGVYNAFDGQYALPVSIEFRPRTMLQSGRTLLASAELAF